MGMRIPCAGMGKFLEKEKVENLPGLQELEQVCAQVEARAWELLKLPASCYGCRALQEVLRPLVLCLW